MIELLAQASSGGLAEAVGTAVGAAILVLGGREGIAAVHRKRLNGNGFNKPLCDERHKRIDEDMNRIFTKLDDIHDAVKK